MSKSYSVAASKGFQPLYPGSTGPILIAEPDALIRDTISLSLTHEGFQTQVAEDGQQVLDCLNSNLDPTQPSNPSIHLIILERTLTDLSGLEICHQLRQQGSTVAILLMGAENNETDVVEGLEAGADDYLKKPFGMRELVARCRALLA